MNEIRDIENALIQKYNLSRPVSDLTQNRVIVSQYSDDITTYLDRFIDIKIKEWSPEQGWACLHIPVDTDDIIDTTDSTITGHKYTITFAEKSSTYICLNALDCKMPKLKVQNCKIPNIWSGQLWKVQIVDNKMIIGYANKNANKNTNKLRCI
jgi:hypothetical protein